MILRSSDRNAIDFCERCGAALREDGFCEVCYEDTDNVQEASK